MKNLILPLSMGLAMAATASAQVTINEVRIDNPGADTDEFFELAGPAATSLDGLTYIVIGDGGGGDGTIEAVIDLTGQSIGASGFFLAGESSMTIAVPDLIAGATGINFENSDNVTHMLVDGFTGVNGDDTDVDDDGTMDFMPWTSVVDRVVFVESPGSGDLIYGLPQVGPDGSFVPGHISMIAGTWVINDFGIGYEDTPGAANDHIPTGTTFCDPAADNSTGDPAVLRGYTGSGVGSDLHLEVTDGVPNEIGYILAGDMFDTVGVVLPGVGSPTNLCLLGPAGANLYRYNVAGGSSNSIGLFDANGTLQNLFGNSTVGSGFDVPGTIPDSPTPIVIMAGSTWHFQAWYRDTPAGSGSSNLTNGLTVTF